MTDEYTITISQGDDFLALLTGTSRTTDRVLFDENITSRTLIAMMKTQAKRRKPIFT